MHMHTLREEKIFFKSHFKSAYIDKRSSTLFSDNVRIFLPKSVTQKVETLVNSYRDAPEEPQKVTWHNEPNESQKVRSHGQVVDYNFIQNYFNKAKIEQFSLESL
jgi:uncharacterized protein involved in type VI secretion and phage assembly